MWTMKQNDKKWELKFDVVYQLMAEELNNEESIGNTTSSRTQIDEDGNVRNKISGESTRHAIKTRMYQIMDASHLCESCKVLNPVKNGEHGVEESEELSPSGARVKGCPLCDVTGFMNPDIGEKRSSVLLVSDAISEVTGTRQQELHTRVDVSENSGGDESEMMIYHSENRNSTYHQTVILELDRIGFDDHRQKYVISKDEMKERVISSVKGVLNHYLDIRGANISAHKPHLLSLKGIVQETTDSSKVNASYSSMTDDYLDVQSLLSEDLYSFDNPGEFKEVVDGLLNDEHLEEVIHRNMDYVNGEND